MWRFTSQNMMSIRKGMTKTEIKRMLGNPDYRNFDRDGEEWVYTTAEKTVIIGFYDELVESMNSLPADMYYNSRAYPGMNYPDYTPYPDNYPGSGNVSAVMRDSEFQELLNVVSRQAFREDKMAAIRSGVSGRSVNCKQCVRMMNLFSFDDDKLQAFNIISGSIIDWENQHLILDNFKFVSSREKARKTIDSMRNR